MNTDRFRFRAIHKTKKIYAEILTINFMSNEAYVKYQHRKDGDFYYDSWKFDEFDPLFCTGLRDSVGTLIWEGDVVEVDDMDSYTTVPPVKYITSVMWKYGAWCIYHSRRIDYQTRERSTIGFGYWTDEALKRIRVVGNIYEHPDLLNNPHATQGEGGG